MYPFCGSARHRAACGQRCAPHVRACAMHIVSYILHDAQRERIRSRCAYNLVVAE